ANCGSCGNACPQGQVCAAGSCSLVCLGGTTKCGGKCADTANDPANCGSCGAACPQGQVCAAGSCSLVCLGGTTKCGSKCADLQTDAANCGACAAACKQGEVCSSGKCIALCPAPLVVCGNVCTNTSFDPQHCGKCNNPCPVAANATPTCGAGVCGMVCKQGYGDCNANMNDGCEIDTTSNASHCGGCGKPCAPVANGTAACTASVCGVGSCNQGFGDCDKNAGNGCEINLTSDKNNCGSCGNVCPNNTPVCSGSKCTNIDLSGLYAKYDSAGRTVYIWKTPKCANLLNYADFCPTRGLKWWRPKSQPDAQQLVSFAYGLDNWHTWVQIYGIKTDQNASTIEGYGVIVDSPGCVASSNGSGFGAFRKWGCSYCYPAQNNNESCCWDKDHAYDWFVCEP
ncbi:MAG: hypothetical protein HY744_17335, partial [Deltaproteobacteria bacterium]|nr:hypothetical protein [Deltaproteobacteria bacterium]